MHFTLTIIRSSSSYFEVKFILVCFQHYFGTFNMSKDRFMQDLVAQDSGCILYYDCFSSLGVPSRIGYLEMWQNEGAVFRVDFRN